MSSSSSAGPKRFLAPLILSAVVLALYWRTPEFLAIYERKAQDLLLWIAPVQRSDLSTCVILIDRKDSKNTARSISEVITAIVPEKPRAIGICDCLAGPDAAFEAAVRSERRTVVGYGMAFDPADLRGGNREVVEKSRIRFSTNPWGKPRRWTPAPQAVVECANARAVDAAAGCGFSNIVSDTDGIARRVPLVAWAGDAPCQGIAVALLAVSRGSGRITLRLKGEAVQGIDIGGLLIRTDSRGRILFREYAGTMACSAADLLGKKLRPGFFSGKIVLIGSNSRRLRTRTSPSVPEASIQAAVVENALRDDYLRRSRGVGFLEIALMIGVPFAVSPLRGWRRWRILLAALILIAGCAALLLVEFRQEMRTLFPTASVILAWLAPLGHARRER